MNRMNKTMFTVLICTVTLFTLGMGIAAAATTVAVSPATVTSDTCETVAIVINTDEAAGIGSVTMDLDYDPAKVTYNGKVADGDLGTMTVNQFDADTLRMTAATGSNPGPTGTVTLVELEFCPAGNPGDCSDLTLTVTEITDGSVAVIIPDSVANGQFCIPNGGATTTTVAVSPATVTSDTCETVAIVINTDEAAGIGSVTMDLDYDPAKVTYNGKVADGDLGTMTVNQFDADTLRMTAATGSNPGPTGTVTLVELEFCPAGNPGDCSDLTLTVTEITDGSVAVIVPDSVANGQFCIGAPNDHPTVNVVSPVSGTVSGTIDVTATATDTDGTVTQVEFFLIPGSLIGTDTNGADGWSVPLDTTTVTDGDYQIKAVATDNDLGTGDDTGGVFAIDNSCPCDFCYDLVAGLNFVSIPKTLVDSPKNATTVFDVDYYSGEFCLYYDALAGSFDLNADVKPCRGFLVYKNAAKTVCVDFDNAAPAPSQQLYVGWNMIGHVKTVTMPINDGTNADFVSITGLEEPEGNLLFRLMATYTGTGWSEYPGSLTDATPGAGYWIYMDYDVMMSGGFE